MAWTTRELLQVQRQLLPTRKFLRETFTRQGQAFVATKLDVQYKKGHRKTAPFVHPLLPGKVMTREGFQQSTYEPALIKPARPITTLDISESGFGENEYSLKTPAQRAQELQVEDQADLDDAITRREEVMVSDLIFTGKVRQIGDGVKQELDFDFTNRQVLTGAARWSEPTSTPFMNLANFKLAVQQKSSINTTRVLMAADVAQAFLSHPDVQSWINNNGGMGAFGAIAPTDQIDGASYIGRITYPGAILELWMYTETYLEDWNDDGTEKATPEVRQLVPNGHIALLPSGNPFEFRYGGITIMGEDGEFQTIPGNRVPQSWTTREPAVRWLQVNSRPMIIPDNVDGWYTAKVL